MHCTPSDSEEPLFVNLVAVQFEKFTRASSVPASLRKITETDLRLVFAFDHFESASLAEYFFVIVSEYV